MALWKEPSATEKESAHRPPDSRPTAKRDEAPTVEFVSHEETHRAKRHDPSESVIATDLTIEGKIKGSGHVRLAGTFKGDVDVDGDLTIEPGAKVTGSVRAGAVVVAGELEGDIVEARSVRLLESAVVKGDVMAGTMTVASGSRMRGQAQCGWDEKEMKATKAKPESHPAP